MYDEQWFAQRASGARRSAEVIVPMLLELTGAKSVLDVGCGTGSWLAVARERGAEVLGVDGDYVPRDQLEIEDFAAHDVSEPLDLGRRFDLALSVEVGEHLPEEKAGVLVESLTRHADVVAFSAAIPGQGGTGHVNERWPSWWAARFQERGYRAADVIRHRVWDDERVRFFYAQNLLVYCAPGVALPATETALDLVHPKLFEAARRLMPPPKDALRHVRQAAAARLRRPG